MGKWIKWTAKVGENMPPVDGDVVVEIKNKIFDTNPRGMSHKQPANEFWWDDRESDPNDQGGTVQWYRVCDGMVDDQCPDIVHMLLEAQGE